MKARRIVVLASTAPPRVTVMTRRILCVSSLTPPAHALARPENVALDTACTARETSAGAATPRRRMAAGSKKIRWFFMAIGESLRMEIKGLPTGQNGQRESLAIGYA